jgi:L-alanine-DL-glutamate epimerase-like enolase superfamily enzyme
VSPTVPGETPRLRIADITCNVLLAPDYDPTFTSSAQDSLLVVVRTEDGQTGIGECDVSLDGASLH